MGEKGACSRFRATLTTPSHLLEHGLHAKSCQNVTAMQQSVQNACRVHEIRYVGLELDME